MGSSSPTTPPPLLQSLLPPHPPKTSPNTLKTFNAPPHLIRRSLLLLLSSTSLTLPLPLPLPLPTPPALALPEPAPAPTPIPTPTPTPTPTPPPDTTITDRVFLDLSLCPSYFRSDRTLGDICPEIQPLGRLVLGLYGKLLPRTVANFKSMCTGSAGSTYRGTLVHKILPGSYFMAGKQGRRDKGEVRPPLDLPINIETVDSRAFALKHLRPGTLSLCLSENDDDEEIKLDPGYRNVEFLITTGPAPCPQLDNRNIIFGTVLEGLDVVTTIATIPTYKPAERIRQFNDLAEFLGDERAQNARTIWNRPLKTIYISDCGELKVAKPSLTPTLP